MAIKTGRYGQVLFDIDPTGTPAPVLIASLNKWALSLKTDHIEVTCFGDENKVYVPGMKDVSGSFGGFWNSDETTLFDAADSPTPGLLKLVPNSTESAYFWSGLAYLDADIDVGVSDAPTVTGTFMAAGAWTREPGASS